MMGLRQKSEDRVLGAALARTEDIVAITGSWGASRRDAVRRLVSDSLSRRLLEIEGGSKTLAQVTAEIQARVDDRDASPMAYTSAALADELLLNFLLAMKFAQKPRLRSTCETIFQKIHRFASQGPRGVW